MITISILYLLACTASVNSSKAQDNSQPEQCYTTYHNPATTPASCDDGKRLEPIPGVSAFVCYCTPNQQTH